MFNSHYQGKIVACFIGIVFLAVTLAFLVTSSAPKGEGNGPTPSQSIQPTATLQCGTLENALGGCK